MTRPPRGRWVLGLAAALAGSLPAAAWGYGIEIPENGAVAFGRGGAFVARASDPSAVMHNTAGIMGLPGFQLMLSSNVGSFSNCYQRAGNYQSSGDASIDATGTVFETPGSGGDAAYLNGRTPYPEVCKEPSVALAPLLLGTYRINRFIGVGFGVYAPSTQGSSQHYPDRVTAAGGVSAPSPARNMLYEKDLLVLHPVVAVSVQPTRWLRVGLGLEPSVANFRFGLNVNAVAMSPQSPSSDVFLQLDATGFFMAGSLGVQVLPLPFLSFGANFHYNAPIDASGTASARALPYSTNPANIRASSFSIDSMKVNLPWTLRASARYNMPRPGRPTQDDGTGTYDPMVDDVFDVEAEFIYERTSMLSTTELTNTGGIVVNDSLTVQAPRNIAISSALSDVMGVRIGGDWNAIPGTLAVRAGFSYETSGVSAQLAQIHLPAYGGASVHAGASYRWRWLTITAGFGQFFFQTNDASTTGIRAITVPSPQIDPATCPNAMTIGAQTCTINRGTYTASFTAGSLGFTAHW